jgi:hypothetical protein
MRSQTSNLQHMMRLFVRNSGRFGDDRPTERRTDQYPGTLADMTGGSARSAGRVPSQYRRGAAPQVLDEATFERF